MLKYKLLSIGIILVCVTISVGILTTGYQKLQDLNTAKNDLKVYEEKRSAGVDALDPSSVSGSYVMSRNVKLVIPKISADYWIRSDTVNAYNSVYHYPESVNPGENGECGLLGHHTIYSAPFSGLFQLNPGDQVIIKDFGMSKKYVYRVTSNGNDLRWDYKGNPVTFAQSGKPRLLLITCYHSAGKTAAWIVHCELESNGPLK
jgi:sortase A